MCYQGGMAQEPHPIASHGPQAALFCRQAEEREACARSLHLIAGDFRRWGLSQQEDDARRAARSMRIAAMLERAKAACLLPTVGDEDGSPNRD